MHTYESGLCLTHQVTPSEMATKSAAISLGPGQSRGHRDMGRPPALFCPRLVAQGRESLTTLYLFHQKVTSAGLGLVFVVPSA